MQHLIQKQILDIRLIKNIKPRERQQEIQSLYWNRILPKMNQAFDQLIPNDQILRLDRLAIDLGRIPLEKLEQEMVKAIVQEIQDQLNPRIQALKEEKKKSILIKGKNAELKPELTAFLFFLQSGIFPWWYEGIDIESPAKLFEKLLKVEAKAINSFLQHNPREVIQQRMIQQFPLELIQKLFAESYPILAKDLALFPQFFQSLSTHSSFAFAKELAQIKNQGSKHYASTIIAHLMQPVPSTIAKKIFIKRLIQSLSNSHSIDTGKIYSSLKSYFEIKAEKKFEVITAAIIELADETLVEKNNDKIDDTNSSMENEKSIEFNTRQKNESKDSIKVSSKNSSNKKEELSVESKNSFQEDNLSQSNKTAAQNQKTRAETDGKNTSIEKQQLNKGSNTKEINEEMATGIYIDSAGMILMANFFPMYFEKVGLLENSQFKSIENQERAAFLINYLVSGETETSENKMLLPKILTGIPLDAAIPNSIELTENEKEQSTGLLNAIIQHWSALGNTSLDGLRDTFLNRQGKIIDQDTSYKLIIERKSLDILMNSIPWGFGLIKLPWMEKQINVEW